MPTRTVLAFDPGKRTGWACVSRTIGTPPEHTRYTFEGGGVFTYSAHYGLDLIPILAEYEPDLIAYEGWSEPFSGTPTSNVASVWPNRIIGGIELYTTFAKIHVARADPAKWRAEFMRPNGQLPNKLEKQA